MDSREIVFMQTETYEIHLKKMSEKATDMPLTLQLSFPICRNNGTNLIKHFNKTYSIIFEFHFIL